MVGHVGLVWFGLEGSKSITYKIYKYKYKNKKRKMMTRTTTAECNLECGLRGRLLAGGAN